MNNTKTISSKIFKIVLKLISRVIHSYSSKPVILCYHSIENDEWKFSRNLTDFEDDIKFLKKNKTIVELSVLINMLSKHDVKLENAVSVTFDDGYKTILENALPILEKYDIKPCVFITNNSKEDISNNIGIEKDLLTNADIKYLISKGWEMGYHTSAHQNLSTLNASQLKTELTTEKSKLEKELGTTLNTIAYPFGILPQNSTELLKQTKFVAGFTADSMPATYKNKYKISRLLIENEHSKSEFEAMFTTPWQLFIVFFNRLVNVRNIIKEKIS